MYHLLTVPLTLALSASFFQPPPKMQCPIVNGPIDWSAVPRLGPFVTPGANTLATIPTEAWVVATPSELVARFRCADPDLKSLMAEPLPHDSEKMWTEDCVEVFLAPGDPTRDYFHWVISAHGDLFDERVPGSHEKRDPSWESNARVETGLGQGEWTCTVRLPLGPLGAAPKLGDEWRLNLCREFRGGQALMSWSPLSEGLFHEPKAFGTIAFVKRAEVLAIDMAPPFVGMSKASVKLAPGSHLVPAVSLVPDAEDHGPLLGLQDGKYENVADQDATVQVICCAPDGSIMLYGPAVHCLVPKIDLGPTTLRLTEIEKRWLPQLGIPELRASLGAEAAGARAKLEDLRKWLAGAFHRDAADNQAQWEDARQRAAALRTESGRLAMVAKALAGRSGPAPSFILGTETPLRKLHPEDWDFQVGQPIRLSAAKREAESIQVVLAPLAAGAQVRQATCSALTGKDGARMAPDAVRIDRVGYVKTRKPVYAIDYVGEWPDPLLPFEPFALDEGRIQPLWVTVTVPPEAPAGGYHGKLTIVDGQGVESSLPIELTVWDFELPLRGTLKTAISTGFRGAIPDWYGWKDRKIPHEYLLRFYDLMLSHRVNPVAIYDGTMWPPAEDLDYCVARGLNSVCMKCTGSATPEEIAEVRADMAELKKRNLLDGAYIYGFDEAQPTTWPDVEKVWHAWKDALPGVKVAGTYPPNDVLDKVVDLWVPLTPWYDNPTAAKTAAHQRAEGDEMWWYVCCGPGHPFGNWFIDYPATDARALFWATYKYRITGFLYYETCMWASNMHTKPAADWEVDHEDPQALAAIAAGKRWPDVPWNTFTFSRFNGDGLLVYPGRDRPLPSIRLETIRDGIEDYEMLALLAQATEQLRARSPQSKLLAEAEGLLKVNPAVVKDLTHYASSPGVIETERERVARCLLAVRAATP